MSDDVSLKVKNFFNNYRSQVFPKGQLLIMNDDTVSQVFYLTRGKVKQYDVTYNGEEIVLNIFKPNSFFPMSLVMSGGKSQFMFAAETEIEVRRAPAEEVIKFVKDNPDVLYDLLSRVYVGVDSILSRLALLMSGTAKTRVLFELYTEWRRFGKVLEDNTIKLSASETDIAARAGLSRETVSREFHKLKEEGILKISGSHIVLLDPDLVMKKLKIDY